MTDSQSPEEGVRREIPEYKATKPQKGSATSFPPNNDHPTLTFDSQTGNTPKTIKVKPSERPDLEKKPYLSPLPEQRCQLVDSPIILEALIEGFQVCRIYVDRGSSSEVMYEHCFQNLRAETKAKLKESRTPLVGFFGEVNDEVQSHHQYSREAGVPKDAPARRQRIELWRNQAELDIYHRRGHFYQAQTAHVNLPQHLAPSVGPGILIYLSLTKKGKNMTDSQSPEEGVGRVLLEFRVTGPQPWSVASFPPDNGHPSPTIVSQIENTSRTVDMKPNKRPGLKKKPYPSSLLEQIFASATQQMSEQAEQVRLRTIVGMIRGHKGRKIPHEQSEQWIYIDKGSSSEVMYEHCFRNLRAKTKAKLKESRTPLVGFSGKVSYPIGTINLNVTMGESKRLRTIPMEFSVVKSHSPYNFILGQTSLRSLGVVASTIHSMIKFPIANGISTVTTK
ncbi:reverse transcriptase domain-containing protein [Tanacetum coccineum]